ncbi:hypothetical protein PTTG_25708 [Puccinia triticina 1-1 BBBD Race 1]|uniref:ubiquitinyl hydrolase 1 n=1 Tax=Puccinia triticina (isolate 1-1 / race 1 (BBBD)) TaxID=630390 RepID=A0A180GZE1_PUCT1|nr:hypothetical protein PTTG_25708 [Puccinia triticina 1-1 BBBD Race 1]
MSLLRWIGVNSSASQSAQNLNPNDPSNEQWWAGSDEKYFGMENFGNTWSVPPPPLSVQLETITDWRLSSYANSVLQALYFCKPFRQLLELSSADPLLPPASQQPAASQSSSSSPHSLTQQQLPNPRIPPSSESPSSNHSKNHVRSKSTGLGLDTLQRRNQQQSNPPPSSSPSPSPTTTTRPRSKSNQLLLTKTLTPSSTSSPAHSQQQQQPPKIHLKTDPNTLYGTQNHPSAPPKTSIPTPANHTKRNWAAADFDQGGVGKFHLPSANPSSSSSRNQTSTPLQADPDQPDPTICSSLRDLFRHISAQPNSVGAVAPQAFITTLKRYNELFRSTMHQDAHEFLNYLVNSVAEDVFAEQEKKRQEDERSSLLEPTPPSLQKSNNNNNNTPSVTLAHPRSTWVHKLFEGVLTNETKCLTCETVTQRDESFLDLSINIHQNTSLTACLRQFSASEMLCQKNKFSCDQCCGLQEAEKRMKIKKLPNVLALHLKRFKYQENLQRYTKLSYRVVFPFELKLFNTTDDIQDPDRLYELWAIVVHIGAGPHHGHYVTILKSHGQWLLFDDNVVTRIEERDIQKYYGDTPSVGSGYVLFYQATDLDLMDLMGVPPEPEDVEDDSEVGTEDSDEIIPTLDDSSQGGLFSAHSSSYAATELKKELPQLATWNGFQPPSSAERTRKNSVPFSSGLSSSSSNNTHPLPSSTSDRGDLSTSTNNSKPPELASQPSPQLGGNHPSTTLQSHQRKFSGAGMVSRSPSTATKFSSLSRSGSHLAPNPIDVRFSPQSSPDSGGLLSPFQTGPSLPKSVSPSAPVRTIPNLPSPKMHDEVSSRSNFVAFLPTSPLTSPPSNGHPSKPQSASSAPKLHRKFSAKFLRRKKSSTTTTSPVQPPPTADPSPHSTSPIIAAATGADPLGLGLTSHEHVARNTPGHYYHQPILSSPLGPDPTDKHRHPQQHFFSPRPITASYRHSLSTALDHPTGAGPSYNGANSLPPSQRNSVHSVFPSSICHPSAFIGASPHPTSSPAPSSPSIAACPILKGAQKPPATASLTEKQQREIKKASEKANKIAVKHKLKALKDRSLNSKLLHDHISIIHNTPKDLSSSSSSVKTPTTPTLPTTSSSTTARLATQLKLSRAHSPHEASHPVAPLSPSHQPGLPGIQDGRGHGRFRSASGSTSGPPASTPLSPSPCPGLHPPTPAPRPTRFLHPCRTLRPALSPLSPETPASLRPPPDPPRSPPPTSPPLPRLPQNPSPAPILSPPQARSPTSSSSVENPPTLLDPPPLFSLFFPYTLFFCFVFVRERGVLFCLIRRLHISVLPSPSRSFVCLSLCLRRFRCLEVPAPSPPSSVFFLDFSSPLFPFFAVLGMLFLSYI